MKYSKTLIPLLLVMAILFSACSSPVQYNSQEPLYNTTPPITTTPAAESPDVSSIPPIEAESQSPDETAQETYSPDTEIQVYIFDVGQADCILIKTNLGHTMLIDAGDVGQDDLINGYLSDCGVTMLDLLVATHPHADHLGSMAGVIRAMDGIGTLLMPDVTHTTKTFENLLDAIEEKEVPVEIPQPGLI